MLEKDFQVLFTKWLREYGVTGAYELKICKKPSLPFREVEEHQIYALQKAKHGIYVKKISDFSPELKPFDCFCLKETVACVVILFWTPNYNKTAYIIDIDMFVLTKETCGRKSITEDMAEQIGTKVIF